MQHGVPTARRQPFYQVLPDTPMMKSLKIVLLLGAAVVAGLAVSVAVRGPDRSPLAGGVRLDQPRPLPAFALSDHRGQPFGPSDLAGRWHLLFSGFTHCPDLCPNTLAILKSVESELGEHADAVQTVFLSVDPERDTPESLASYVHYFSPNFVGVTGERAQIDTLMRGLGLAYAIGDTSDPGYTVDHSAALVVIDPQGRVAAYLSAPHKPGVIAEDLKRMMGA